MAQAAFYDQQLQWCGQVTPCLPLGAGLFLGSLAMAIPSASLSGGCAWTLWGNKGRLKLACSTSISGAAHRLCPLPVDGACGEEAGAAPEHTSEPGPRTTRPTEKSPLLTGLVISTHVYPAHEQKMRQQREMKFIFFSLPFPDSD